jgi:hypothetical protein
MRRKIVIDIIKIAVLSRLGMLTFMAVVCNVLPTFNPGDDVQKFNSRLLLEECDSRISTTNSSSNTSRCQSFCRRNDDVCNSILCNISSDVKEAQRYQWLDIFYKLILPPLTRWDAARFLSVAVDPTVRHPRPFVNLEQKNFNSSKYCTFLAITNATNSIADNPTCTNDEFIKYHGGNFNSSEQAHAFMPLLPISIRFLANHVLIRIIPLHVLPPTYEGTCILSGLILNVVAFSIAGVMLYELTLLVLKKQQQQPSKGLHLIPNNDEDNIRRVEIAQLTVVLFCCNPANIFFTAVYSEALFAALTFTG